jgi:DNA invertase Pin-like site-specific DNA recombinase
MSDGRIVGYARVSSDDQHLDRQLAALDGLSLSPRTGEPLIFTDKFSGKDTERPGLNALLDYVREGDTMRVADFSRLSRDLGDLRRLVKQFTDSGVTVEFLHERLTFSGDDSPISNLMLNLLGAVHEFERSQIRRRAAEGIALAKTRGAYTGRAAALKPDQITQAQQQVASGVSKSRVASDLGVSRQTLYTALASAGTYATAT